MKNSLFENSFSNLIFKPYNNYQNNDIINLDNLDKNNYENFNLHLESSIARDEFNNNVNLDMIDIDKIKQESDFLFNSNYDSNENKITHNVNFVNSDFPLIIPESNYNTEAVVNNLETKDSTGAVTNTDKFKLKLKEIKFNMENYLDSVKINFNNYIESQKTHLINTIITIENIVNFPVSNSQQEEDKKKTIEKKIEDLSKEINIILTDISKFNR